MSAQIEIPARPTSPRPQPVTFECPTCHTAHVNQRPESLNIQYCDECGRATCVTCGIENRDQCERCGKWYCYRHINLVGKAPREAGTPAGPWDTADAEDDERQMLCLACAALPVRMVDAMLLAEVL